MVLDTVQNDEFVFKNTDQNNQQVRISVTDGPLEFYFVHIDLTEEGKTKVKYDPSELEAEFINKMLVKNTLK